jgi:transposase-like protein
VQENAITPAFHWTKPKERAAVLLAEDDITDAEIAAQVGVNPATLWRWKQHPEFAARVGDHTGQLQAAMLRYRVAKKRERMRVLDDLHTKLLTVIEDRGVEYEDDAPGTRTGLVTKTFKMVGAGRDATLVTEWGVDTPTVREIRAIQEQAAKELGQWVEKGEISGPGGSPLVIRSISVPLPVRDDANGLKTLE